MQHLNDAQKTCNDTLDWNRFGSMVGPFLKEVQSPVGNLIAASEMLDEAVADDDSTGGFVRLIHQEAERIHEVVNDLVRLSNAEELCPTFIDLPALLRGALEEVRPLAARHGVRITCRAPSGGVRVWADPNALRMALAKPLAIAIGAMPSGGVLSTEVDAKSRAEEGFVNLSISDTGPAVSPKRIPHIFEPFAAVQGRRPGMGLALCKKLVQAMDGKVTGQLAEGGGFTVTLALPCDGPRPHPARGV